MCYELMTTASFGRCTEFARFDEEEQIEREIALSTKYITSRYYIDETT